MLRCPASDVRNGRSRIERTADPHYRAVVGHRPQVRPGMADVRDRPLIDALRRLGSTVDRPVEMQSGAPPAIRNGPQPLPPPRAPLRLSRRARGTDCARATSAAATRLTATSFPASGG